MKTRQELIKAYVEFFKSKNHKHIPSASLIPENDPTVLFTTAGMHPLVPFLQGEKHPLGKRLVNVQKCVRTGDIDEVGDEVHHTFFEMLGNWSLGDYWKKEAIEFSYEFLTRVLKLDKAKLAVTCFAGDAEATIGPDEESARIWLDLGVKPQKMAFMKRSDNWWGPAGEVGPCGPDTEMFYWSSEQDVPEKFDPRDKRWVEIWNDVFMEYEKRKKVILVDGMNCLYDEDFNVNKKLYEVLQGISVRKIIVVNGHADKARELFKDFEVFSCDGKITKEDKLFFERLFEKHHLREDGVIYFDHKAANVETARKYGVKKVLLYEGDVNKVEDFLKSGLYYYKKLKQKNVDTGMGVERTLAVLNGLDDNYLTPVFEPIIQKIENISRKEYDGNENVMRIIADHVRASVFILGDERAVKPSNVGQGYVLRRLIRRAVRYGRLLGIEGKFLSDVARGILPIYPDYQELHRNHGFIMDNLDEEEERFRKTLENGLKKFEEIARDEVITGKEAFLLFQSYGFPIEMTQELALEKGVKVDLEEYNQEFQKHQDLSRTASAGQFKSGLADDSEATRKLHTATHLLNEALRRVLGKEVKQKGSNITPERLRFDFNFSRKLTPEELIMIEDLVNAKILAELDVEREEVPLQEALDSGAQAEFGMKYPDLVSVYIVLDSDEKKGWFSREICTGPHVRNTREIGKFKILKEESSAAGVRRIKAVVE